MASHEDDWDIENRLNSCTLRCMSAGNTKKCLEICLNTYKTNHIEQFGVCKEYCDDVYNENSKEWQECRHACGDIRYAKYV